MSRSPAPWLALLVSMTAAISTPASATVMVEASVEQLAAHSDLVVLGTVRAATPTDGGPRPGIFTFVELEVEQTWRGAPVDRIGFWTFGGRLGARAMQTHGAASFELGERVVVFLDDVGGGVRYVTGMSQGKWRVDGELARSCADPGSLVRRGPGGSLVPVEHAPVGLPLDLLRDRVRSVR